MDVDEFRLEFEMAEKEINPDEAMSHYLKAEAVYSGDFLMEDMNVDWCAEERARLKEDYLDLLLKIMMHHERKGDYSRCIEYARKYLDVDKYAETIYQHLMRYYSLTGNKAMVGITFERCKNNIRNNNSSLDKKTETLYLELS